MATPTALPSSFTAGDVLTAANMNLLRGAFRILQVVSDTKTDTFTTTSTSFVDITGLSVSITPTSNTSKVLVFYAVQALGLNGINMGALNLVRDSTNILLADAAGSRIQASNIIGATTAENVQAITNLYLDSPATTSATTYKVQIRTAGAGTIYVNRTITDTNSGDFVRGTSTLVACEVSA